MNQVTIIGNLVANPELRQTTSGKSVCKFTVACNNGKDSEGKDRPADFITCQAWDKKAELVSRWWTKGKPIALTGSFKTDKYQDKNHEDVTHYNSYVLVNNVEFVGGKSDGGNAAPAEKPATKQEALGNIPEADIPF